MVVTFEEEYLKDLYEKGKCSAKKYRYQPQVIEKYQRRVETLQSVESPEKLYQFNSLNFEALKGDRAGRYSIRMDLKYRIEFTLNSTEEEPVIIICNIVELSNHYD